MVTLVAGALTLACARQPEVAGAGDPKQAVRDYFAAVATRDCPGLKAAVAGEAGAAVTEAGCEAVFDEFAEHGVRLEEVESARADGRDPKLQLVKARLGAGEDAQIVVVGVRRSGGRWRVVRI